MPIREVKKWAVTLSASTTMYAVLLLRMCCARKLGNFSPGSAEVQWIMAGNEKLDLMAVQRYVWNAHDWSEKLTTPAFAMRMYELPKQRVVDYSYQ